MDTKLEIVTEKHLEFLDELRESGVTNMFGAGSYLVREFFVTMDEANQILQYWMNTFGERQEQKKNLKMEISTKEKVTRAFKELRKHGYFARQNFLCCQSCGWAAVPEDKAEKVVFYHAQDAESWNNHGELDDELYLAWSGSSEEICEILRRNGLKIEHDGSENTRIAILP